MLVSDIKSDFTFKNFENFVMRKHMKRYNFREARVLLNKLVVMVTPGNLGN